MGVEKSPWWLHGDRDQGANCADSPRHLCSGLLFRFTWKWKCSSLSPVRLFVTPWTVDCEALVSRQECWGGLPLPSPGDLPDSGIKPQSSAVGADSSLLELRWLLSASTTPKTLLFRLLLVVPPLYSASGSHGKNMFCLKKAGLLAATYFYIGFIPTLPSHEHKAEMGYSKVIKGRNYNYSLILITILKTGVLTTH